MASHACIICRKPITTDELEYATIGIAKILVGERFKRLPGGKCIDEYVNYDRIANAHIECWQKKRDKEPWDLWGVAPWIGFGL